VPHFKTLNRAKRKANKDLCEQFTIETDSAVEAARGEARGRRVAEAPIFETMASKMSQQRHRF
jgi:hypothetical protein